MLITDTQLVYTVKKLGVPPLTELSQIFTCTVSTNHGDDKLSVLYRRNPMYLDPVFVSTTE